MEVRQVAAGRILSPSRLGLGEYVINPYKGCFFDCVYCYERKSRRQARETRDWGEFVDAKINAVLRLERDIMQFRPKSVLIGSTSDCFQPAEARFHLTGKIIRVLNRHRIRYTIITRSPLIARFGIELDPELCRTVIFTVNSLPPQAARLLEPHSASLAARFAAIESLRGRGLRVSPAFAPYLPGLSRADDVLKRVPRGSMIRVEGLNFNVGNMPAVINAAARIDQRMGRAYARMRTDESYYRKVWAECRKNLSRKAASHGVKLCVCVHRLHPARSAPGPLPVAAGQTTRKGENYELF